MPYVNRKMINVLLKLIEQAGTIIAAASGSMLGVLSLIILVFAILSFLFFGQSSQEVRIGIFVSLFVGVSLLIIATNSPNSSTEPPVGGVEPENQPQSLPIPDDKPAPKIEKPTNNNQFDLTGDWEFDLERSRIIDNNGVIRNSSRVSQWWIRINQSGEKISGRFLGAQNACSGAKIDGNIENDKIEWIVSYTGQCCQGSQLLFQGKVTNDTEFLTISGDLSPVEPPPVENCTLSWAQLSSTKSID